MSAHPSLVEPAEGWTMVGIDVLRATTTAITAVLAGRRCFPVPSLEAAVPLAGRLTDPLLVGELGGNMPFGFHEQNSPASMAAPGQRGRPVILLSTTGTRLLCEAAARGRTYAACLRNAQAQAEWLVGQGHRRVLLIAGESRGEFREEDRLCCARIAGRLVASGYSPHEPGVQQLIGEWGRAPDDAFLGGRSVAYLEATDQQQDVRFVLEHIDDVNQIFEMRDGELVIAGAAA